LCYVIWLGFELPHFGGFDFENYVCLYSSVSNFQEGVARRRRGGSVRAFSKFVWFCPFFLTGR
jgi:hypothetical protein